MEEKNHYQIKRNQQRWDGERSVTCTTILKEIVVCVRSMSTLKQSKDILHKIRDSEL